MMPPPSSRRAGLVALPLLFFTALAVSSPVRAGSPALAALSLTVPEIGSTLDQARATPFGGQRRLLCEGDAEAGELLDPTLLRPSTRRGAERVRICTVVVPGAGGRLEQAMIGSLAGEVRVWMVFVEQGGNGHYRLARLSLWAEREAWDRVGAALTETLGDPDGNSSGLLSWESGQQEVLMFKDTRDTHEMAIAIVDLRLRKLLKSPGFPARAF